MSAPHSTGKQRRPKSANYTRQRAVRLGDPEETAVGRMRTALAKQRRVPVDAIDFSEALRLLLGDNERAARILAGQPEAWTPSRIVEVPAELWNGLNECRNAVVHARGSMYAILRKVNFDEGPVTRAEMLAAFDAVRSSLESLEHMEISLVELVGTLEAAADAKAVGEVP